MRETERVNGQSMAVLFEWFACKRHLIRHTNARYAKHIIVNGIQIVSFHWRLPSIANAAGIRFRNSTLITIDDYKKKRKKQNKTTSDLHLRGHSIDRNFIRQIHLVGVLVNSTSIDRVLFCIALWLLPLKMTLPQSSESVGMKATQRRKFMS